MHRTHPIPVSAGIALLLLLIGTLPCRAQQGRHHFRNVPCWAVDSVLRQQPRGASLESYSFDCVPPGFRGYFAPHRWAIRLLAPDGAVGEEGWDGLPVEEDAGALTLRLPAGMQLRLAITLPAEGFLQFDWCRDRQAGIEGAFSSGKRSVSLEGPAGRFLSPALDQGDRIQLNWTNASDRPADIVLEELTFFTPAHGVRIWPLGENRRLFEVIMRPRISQIILPSDEVFPGNDRLHPDHTGWPYLDGDGQPLTKHDQRPLSDGAFPLEVRYEDTYRWDVETTILHRRWVIEEPCTGNQISGVQKIYLPPRPSLALPYAPLLGP